MIDPLTGLRAPIEWQRVHNPRAPLHSETWRHLTKPLAAIRSLDMGRWHLSVSHRDRIPTWGELGMARDALLPAELHFMLPHPPRRHWLNVDARVLHLWEMRDPEMAEQFEWEAADATRLGQNNPPDDGEAP